MSIKTPGIMPTWLFLCLRRFTTNWQSLPKRPRPARSLRAYAEDDSAVPGLDEAEGVLRWVAGKRFSELVSQGPKVRWLHTASAGVDHVLTAAVREKASSTDGFTLTNSGPAFEIAISEFVLAWMLLVARRLPELLAHQRTRVWQSETQQELWGQTVGIVGLGPIGRGVASRAKAFGMRTLGLRRQQTPVPSVDAVLTGANGLRQLLRESDWVVLAAALTQESRSLIGPDQLAQMKPSAWLINIARGGLVDETALTSALQSGQIAGACLDVFAQEPLPPTARCGGCRTSTSPRTTRRAGREDSTSARRRCFWTTCAASPTASRWKASWTSGAGTEARRPSRWRQEGPHPARRRLTTLSGRRVG